MKILLIDNYDSFTYNLYHYLSSLRCKVDVYRNDKINIANVEFMHCNKDVGCKTMIVINDEAVNIMKEANELGITFAIFGTNQQDNHQLI